jgi:hypothetical protein
MDVVIGDIENAHTRTGRLTHGVLTAVPKPQMVTSVNAWKTRLPHEVLHSPVPEKWKVSKHEMAKRGNGGEFSRVYELSEHRNSKQVSEIAVGRVWSANFPFNFVCRSVTDLFDINLRLQPVYSGLAEESIERQSINAASALPFLFDGSRTSDFPIDVRHGIRDLLKRPFNPYRFVLRVAVMWLAARKLEQSGGRLEVRSLEGAPEIVKVEGPAKMRNLVNAAVRDGAQIAYFEVSTHFSNERLSEIAVTAMSAKPTFVSGVQGLSVPSICELWPEINKPVLGVYGTDSVYADPTILTSEAILGFAEVYCGQYGIENMWKHALETAATFLMRPEGDTVLCGHKTISLAMPMSRMEAAAIGPLTLNIRVWESEREVMLNKSFDEIQWEGSSRYMLWSLAYRDVSCMLGGNLMRYKKMDVDQARAYESAHVSCSTEKGFQGLVEEYAGKFGWEGLLGSILRTTIGLTTRESKTYGRRTGLIPVCHAYALQWEEAIVHLDYIPEGASATSILHPATTGFGVPQNTWVPVSHIENRIATQDAFFSLWHAGCRRFAMAEPTMPLGQVNFKQLDPIMSYRNVPVDHSFTFGWIEVDVKVIPTFMLRDLNEVAGTIGNMNWSAQNQWFINQYRDASFQGLLNEFIDLDKGPKPKGEQMAVEQYRRKKPRGEFSDVEESEKSGESISEPPETPRAISSDPGVEKFRLTEQMRTRQATMKEYTEHGRPFDKPTVLEFDRRYNTIVKHLGNAPTWLQLMKKARADREDVISGAVDPQADFRGKILRALHEVKSEEPLLWATALAEAGDAEMETYKSLRYMLEFGMSQLSATSMAPEFLTVVNGLDNMIAVITAEEQITSALKFRRTTGRMLPPGLTDSMFNRGIQAGIKPSEMLKMANEPDLANKLENQIRLVQEAIKEVASPLVVPPSIREESPEIEEDIGGLFPRPRSSVEYKKPPGFREPEEQAGGSQELSVQIGKAPKVEVKGPPPLPKDVEEEKEVKIMETREEVATVELQPKDTKVSDFGGVAHSAESTVTVQDSKEEPASSAESSSLATGVTFQAGEPSKEA